MTCLGNHENEGFATDPTQRWQFVYCKRGSALVTINDALKQKDKKKLGRGLEEEDQRKKKPPINLEINAFQNGNARDNGVMGGTPVCAFTIEGQSDPREGKVFTEKGNAEERKKKGSDGF